MKKHLLGLFLILASSTLIQAQVLITGFGSGTFNPFNTSTDFISPWTGTQTATSVSVVNVSNQSGGIYSTLGTPINITGQTSNLLLTGSLTGANPVTNQFQLTLYDSSFNSLSYNFTWSSFSGGPRTVSSSLALTSGTFNGTVSSYGLSLFGGSGDTVSYTFNSVNASAAPEPSTCLMLALGLCLLVVSGYRRLRLQ